MGRCDEVERFGAVAGLAHDPFLRDPRSTDQPIDQPNDQQEYRGLDVARHVDAPDGKSPVPAWHRWAQCWMERGVCTK